jgi:beta-galactosidase
MNGTGWATSSVRTTGAASGLRVKADRSDIAADGEDLSFVTLEIVDGSADVVRNANDVITFSVEGLGDIVATDNGFEVDFSLFLSKERNTLNGLALAIVKAKKGESGIVTITARAGDLEAGSITVTAK